MKAMTSLTLFLLCIGLLLAAYASIYIPFDWAFTLSFILVIAAILTGARALVVNHQEHTNTRRR